MYVRTNGGYTQHVLHHTGLICSAEFNSMYMYTCICSAKFRNMCNLEIVLHDYRILKMHANLEIIH